jgi:hypothetical protein
VGQLFAFHYKDRRFLPSECLPQSQQRNQKLRCLNEKQTNYYFQEYSHGLPGCPYSVSALKAALNFRTKQTWLNELFCHFRITQPTDTTPKIVENCAFTEIVMSHAKPNTSELHKSGLRRARGVATFLPHTVGHTHP